MKTDKISFGQTYIRPTLIKNIAAHNLPKVHSLIGFGELYPADIYMGADKEGNLILDIVHSTMAKYLYFSDEVPKTTFNTSLLQFMHFGEKSSRKLTKYNIPVYNIKINNLDYFTTEELQYAVNDKLVNYYNNMLDKKLFH